MLLFSLDKEKTLSSRTLTLSIDQALTDTQFLQKATPSQSVLFKYLLEEELYFRQQEGSKKHATFSSFRVRASKSKTLLQHLASTSKVYFNKKPLVLDFFSPLTLAFDVKAHKENFHVLATLKGAHETCLLRDVEFYLPFAPFFVIVGGILKFMKEGTSLKNIQPEASFSPQAFEEFKKEIEDDEDPLEINYQNEEALLTCYSASASFPTPELHLTDARGAFANLFFNSNGKSIQFSSQKDELVFEKDLIECGYQKRTTENSHYFCPVDKISETLDFLLDLGWKIYDFKKREVVRFSDIECSFQKENNDLIELQGTLLFSSSTCSLASYFDALKANQHWVCLSEKKVGLLPTHDKKLLSFQDLKDEIIFIGKTAHIKKQALGLLPKEFACTLDSFERRAHNLESFSFQGSLRHYQKEGVDWLLSLFHNHLSGILADDMGLGKTIQTIAFLSLFKGNLKALIVAPASLLFNWQKEFQKFLPEVSTLIFSGKEKAELHKAELHNDWHVCITSYGMMRKELASLQKIHFSHLILDEAQTIKNSETQTAQAAIQLKADFKLSITGTPLENSLDELVSQFSFLMPGFLEKKDLLAPIFRLKKKITPFILRRKKEDVAKDLPEKIEHTVLVEMEDEQKLIYERTLTSFQKGLLKKIQEDGAEKHTMEILEAILRLRQIALSPKLCPKILKEGENPSSQKFDTVLSDLETVYAEGKKVLVFSQFTEVLHLFKQEAIQRNWKFCLLDGSTTHRHEVVDTFQNDPETKIFFISLKAGGVGLNLQAADYVFLFDPWWNEAVERQAIDRAHRIGRQGTVIVKRYIVKGSIEEQIQELKAEKRKVIDALFDETGAEIEPGTCTLLKLLEL